MRKMLLMTAFLCASLVAPAQTRERGEGLPPGENVIGKVTAATKDSLTVAPMMGGPAVTVKISGSTRVMKDREPIKLEEIKADDTIFARGNLSGNTMEAALVTLVTPEMIQRMHGPGANAGAGGNAGSMFNRADMGKKFIAGEVKAINETKLTIARPDGQTQDIEVDENTSFKKGTESITLPDIKVGDFVRGPGNLKDNVFVPKELMVGRPQMRIMMGGPGANSPEKKPESEPSSPTPTPAPPK